MKLLLLAFFISLVSCMLPTHEERGHNPAGTRYVIFYSNAHSDTVQYDVWTHLTSIEGTNYIINEEAEFKNHLIVTTAPIKKLEK